MNINQMCMKCMMGKINEDGICTSCGTLQDAEKNGSIHLPIRTILRGKYLVGKVIGEGGFGITYIGYDLDLEICVAIKEFCPKAYTSRDVEDGITLYLCDESKEEVFAAERDKFINEARRLAKFRNEGGVVSIMDYFIENGTAYIVMDYIDGLTLKSYLKTLRNTTGKSMNMAGVLKLFKPIMEALVKIHKAGIIHRDISPENIMISKDFKKIYLIDFGTARDMESDHTLSEYHKGFYTPIEQRISQSKGKMEQGPWTDVYALCATIYLCITGRIMPDSVARITEDDIIMPSKFGITISPEMEAVLMHGLAVKPENRIQSVEELMQGFYGDNETMKPAVKKEVSNVNVVVEKPKVANNNSQNKHLSIETIKYLKQDLKQKCKKITIGYIIVACIISFLVVLPINFGAARVLYGMGIPTVLCWLGGVGVFYLWNVVLLRVNNTVLISEQSKILLTSQPSVEMVLFQIESIKALMVRDGKVFRIREVVNWNEYKAKYYINREKIWHVSHQFHLLESVVVCRHHLIDYYNTVILPSNLPEELKAEWKQAAIDSWVIIEE